MTQMTLSQLPALPKAELRTVSDLESGLKRPLHIFGDYNYYLFDSLTKSQLNTSCIPKPLGQVPASDVI